MHPGFAYWWHARRHARGGHCGPSEAHAGAPGHDHGDHDHGPHDHDHGRERGRGFAGFGFRGGPPPWAGHGHGHGEEGGDFGVRRPLRFLAHKLDLRDEQVAELARILDDLKTERAQGAVDHRRTTAAFADAIAAESFDEAKVKEGADVRVKSAERLRDAVVTALGRIHAVLDAEQRAKLAYMLRTGALSM